MARRRMRQTTEISIHALREEGDMEHGGQRPAGAPISIHALREEGDPYLAAPAAAAIEFQSTPSARRATRRRS